MVQSYQSPVRVYKYPFELVMAAYVRRFPVCDMIPIMASSEVRSQTTSEEGAVEEISRKCKLNIDAPYLLKKIVGVDYVEFIQTNCLDRRNRCLTINAKNESFLSRIIINEDCKYSVHPENSDWTCFEQNASLDVKSFFGFESTVEKIAIKQYSANISKGKEIIEHFIEILRQENITAVPIWQSPQTPKKPIAQNVKPSEEDPGSQRSSGESDLHMGSSASNLPKRMGSLKMEETLSKLDADYIKRCLGDLTPLQESRLVQLKKCIMGLQKGKVPSDTTLLRFLKARDFNLEKSREMLSQSLLWRKKHQVDRMLCEYHTPDIIKDYFPGGWHHSDQDGHPLYLLKLGQMDIKGLIKSVGEEGLMKYTLNVCEEGLRLAAEATAQYGRPITTWTVLVDLEGLNMRHLWRPGIKVLLRIIEVMENNYPETMRHVLIIRAPRVFPILWTLISTFIDENSRSKFLFYGGNDYQEAGGLVDYMHKDIIPDFLSGPCKTRVHAGGVVPKSLYLPGEEVDALGQVSEQSIYHSVSLAKGQVHERVLLVAAAGAVICWDFDVMKSDVQFCLLRTHMALPTPTEPPHSPGVIDAVMGSDEVHRSTLDKCWKEGVDFYRMETPLICHDGESVQGSHVTSHTGTYILQWKHPETSHHHSKVMYYFETLKSADYKGSMTSLASGQSAFSCLSSQKSSGCPSR